MSRSRGSSFNDPPNPRHPWCNEEKCGDPYCLPRGRMTGPRTAETDFLEALVAGIMIDWTRRIAGRPSPWCDDVLSLEEQLNALGVSEAYDHPPQHSRTQGYRRESSWGWRRGVNEREHAIRLSGLWAICPTDSKLPLGICYGSGISNRTTRRRGKGTKRSDWPEIGGFRWESNMERSMDPLDSTTDTDTSQDEGSELMSDAQSVDEFTDTNSRTQPKQPHISAIPNTFHAQTEQPHLSTVPISAPRITRNRHQFSKSNSTKVPPAAVFLSQLIPSYFSWYRRQEIIDILHFEAPYLPACIALSRDNEIRYFFGSLRTYVRQLSKHCEADTLVEIMPSSGRPGFTSHSANHHVQASVDTPGSIRSSSLQDSNIRKDTVSDRLPVEVIVRIIQYLNREDAKNLRLTSKYLNDIARPDFYTNVVLSLSKSLHHGKFENICTNTNIDPTTRTASSSGIPASLEIEHTNYMFRDIGHNIRKFGMAFEFDEAKLDNLPDKIISDEISYFWGIGTWPRPDYVRFNQISVLEIVADQCQSITDGFRNMKYVTTLGLSLLSGYGWLHGPDQSDRRKIYREPHEVFGPRCMPPDPQDRDWLIHKNRVQLDHGYFVAHDLLQYTRLLNLSALASIDHLNLVADYMLSTPMREVSRMTDRQIHRQVKRALEKFPSDIRNPAAMRLAEKDLKQVFEEARLIADHALTHPKHQIFHRDYEAMSVLWKMVSSNSMYQYIRDVTEFNHGLLARIIRPASGRDNSRAPELIFNSIDIVRSGAWASKKSKKSRKWQKSKKTEKPENPENPEVPDLPEKGSVDPQLKTVLDAGMAMRPGKLSQAQMQWLIENQWAQDAFMNTYIMAIIDNPISMSNVKTFIVSNLSGSYLSMLYRADVWDSLPNLENLTLLVAADWRLIERVDKYTFKDRPVLPSACVQSFRMLLSLQIARRSSIKHLHIGYATGGEHATGLFARNRHILPAPIMDPKMSILTFPHVETLTLSNCWFTSYILILFVRKHGELKAPRLHRVKLDSVSLVAFGGVNKALEPQHQNLLEKWPGNQAEPPRRIYGIRVLGRDPNPQSLYTFPHGNQFNEDETTERSIDECLDMDIAEDSWLEVLDDISPGTSIDEHRFVRALGPKLEGERVRFLRTLELVSCGYVQLAYQCLPTYFQPYDILLPSLPRDMRGSSQHFMHSQAALAKRMSKLRGLMMNTFDIFIGQIIPRIPYVEQRVLTEVFGVRLGWDSNPDAWLNIEDAQLRGGSGRISCTFCSQKAPKDDNEAYQVDPWAVVVEEAKQEEDEEEEGREAMEED